MFSLISYFYRLFFLYITKTLTYSFLLLGICLFIFFIRSKDNNLKEILLLLLILTILIIFIFVGKNHDDFLIIISLYFTLTEYTHPLGLGKINNGFRSPSSIFFISSMLYLPGANFIYFI